MDPKESGEAAPVEVEETTRRNYTLKDVGASVFIAHYAQHLKRQGTFEGAPVWVDLVKTSCAKELSPYDPDWLYIRAASLLRQLYIHPDKGLGGLRKFYSSKKRRGTRPGHTCKAGGAILRHCLKEFERMELVQKNDSKGGRRLTKRGYQDLDQVAHSCPTINKLY
eukprot:GHVU01041003.1.p1 GENE.GHVU01041003.1~~GHVU01041003.1.p1  ORF type:complete len:166 (-),score=30.22 GHVU01041003.1:464-961(-)